jgi:predicted nuclease with RNAse H fold
MISLGIDVSIKRGLDLVWLDEKQRIVRKEQRVALDDLSVLLDDRPAIIAIDSPPASAPETGRRETEIEIWRTGLQLFPTPSERKRSLKGADVWMETGMAVFKAVDALGFPLFSGEGFVSTAIEVFPHASAVVLSGCLPPQGAGLKHPKAKMAWRASVLSRLGVASHDLETLDQIDAALAALTGLYALAGEASWRGVPAEGVIVLPCRQAQLAQRYVRKEPGSWQQAIST